VKSIKGYLYELQKEKLELEQKAVGLKFPKALSEEFEKRIDTLRETAITAIA